MRKGYVLRAQILAGCSRRSCRLLQLLLKLLGRVGITQVYLQPLQLRLNLLVAGVQGQREFGVGNRFGKLSHALRTASGTSEDDAKCEE